MVSRQSIKGLTFNEKLKSGQEYNLYSRFLLDNTYGVFIHENLSKRRIHSVSIQVLLNIDALKKKKELLTNEIILLNDIKEKASKPIIKRSLNRIIRFSYETQKKIIISKT